MKKIQLSRFFASIIFITSLSNHLWAMETKEPIYALLAKKEVFELQHKHEDDIAFWGPESEYVKPFDAEKKYAELLVTYKNYEENLEQIKDLPEASVWGGINYAMSLDEMKQKIKETFHEMKEKGLIVARDEFEHIKGNYYALFTDLTRIWGGEYLKRKINESSSLRSKYDVPQYIIILDDHNKISVEFSFINEAYPVVRTLNNGEISFERIAGPGVASWNSPIVNDIGIKSGIGYDDFSDPGNIRQSMKNGKYYIIDIEAKSFKIPVNNELKEILDYAQKRFMYLNPKKYTETYEFDI